MKSLAVEKPLRTRQPTEPPKFGRIADVVHDVYIKLTSIRKEVYTKERSSFFWLFPN